MTLRFYCEQMGLRVRCRRANSGWACEIVGCTVNDERIPASAHAATREEARIALVRLIAGEILHEAARPSTQYWVPEHLTP